jgi:thiol-disulfide isomerase/thioredoxin
VRVTGITISVLLGGLVASRTLAAGGPHGHLAAGDGVVVPVAQRPLLPDIRLSGLDGRPLSLRSYRGAVTVLNFWGSWCGPCRGEERGLSLLSRAYPGRVHFLGVDVRDERAAAGAFRRFYKVTYPSFFDPTNRVALIFHTVQPATTPETFVIDASGRLEARFTGAVLYSQLRHVLEQALAA